MAVSPLFAIALRRMIARLEDNFPLSSDEQRKLDAYLSAADTVDVERKFREIKAGNDFMLLPVDHPGWTYVEMVDQGSLSDFHDKLVLAKRETGHAVNGIERASKKLARYAKLGYKNPSIIGPVQADLDKWTRLLANYVDSVRVSYEALNPELRRRTIFHRGPWAIGNLPVYANNSDLLFWPDRPVARRQAYIEVLTAKLL